MPGKFCFGSVHGLPQRPSIMLAATFFTLQASEPAHERFSELRCSKVTLGSDPTRVQTHFGTCRNDQRTLARRDNRMSDRQMETSFDKLIAIADRRPIRIA